jgi:hypothetical protein
VTPAEQQLAGRMAGEFLDLLAALPPVSAGVAMGEPIPDEAAELSARMDRTAAEIRAEREASEN